jgi:putative transposase
MARLTRLCIPGWPHLVVQRGHDRGAVFVDDVDRALFRNLLQEAAVQHGVQVHAYGLRDNEVRLLAKPMSGDGLSKLIQSIGRGYVIRFNRRHGRRGGLWEGRFRATVVQPERHLLECMLFVEGAADGAPSGPSERAWSSAPHHLGAKVDVMVTEPPQYWALGNTPFDREASYRQLFEQALTNRQIDEIGAALQAGWPLGTPEFRRSLEAKTERRLEPLPRGRPRKAA